MLQGRYGDTTNAPYVEARLHIPRLGIVSDISFLVDTGADTTMLMPADRKRIGINLQSAGFQKKASALGLGGKSSSFLEPAHVYFSEKAKVYKYEIELWISANCNDDLIEVPSLLGRDVLRRWDMNYCPTKDILDFVVVTADEEYDLL